MIAGIFDKLLKKKTTTEETEDVANIEYPYDTEAYGQMGGYTERAQDVQKESSELDMDSELIYNSKGPEYHLKLKNKSIDMLGDLTILLRVNKKKIACVDNPKQVVEMLKAGKSVNLKFMIKPKYRTGKSGIYGKIDYFDFKSKERKTYRLPQAYIDFEFKGIKSKKINEDQWRRLCSGKDCFEIETDLLKKPPGEVFKVFRRVLNKFDLFMLPPIENVNLYRGIIKGYGYDHEGINYTIEAQIIGGKEDSKVLFRVWSEDVQHGMAFSFKILNIIDRIIEIKKFIVET